MGAKDDKDPVSVNHSSESSLPFMPTGIGPTIHHTDLEYKDGSTVRGSGWSRDEADKEAGERGSRGERD